MIQTAKEKRKDKISDAEHLKKLREQIAQDRANRKKDYEAVSAEEKAQNDEKIRKIKEEKLREKRERLEEQRRMRDTMARIQFRFSDGSTATSTFEATQKLSEARSHIVANDLVHGAFVLGVAMPRRRFTAEDEEMDFRSLGLTPSAVLTVLPISSSSASSGQNKILQTIMTILYFPIDIIISILHSIFGTGQPLQNRDANNQHNPNPMAGNSDVRRRRRGDLSDDEDRPTYNGNSTNQL